MIRAFLAVEISDEVRTAIVQVQQDIKDRLTAHISPGDPHRLGATEFIFTLR